MKGIGDMVKRAQQMQRKMAELQQQMAEARFEASAGGGTVKAVVDGKQGLKQIVIAPSLVQEGDATMIEDLVLTAVAEAQRSAEAKMNETLGKLTGGLPMPF